MSSKINQYITRIVNQTDCSTAERQEMYDEMYDHLTLIQNDYMEKGYSKQESEEMAIRAFGHEAAIGDELQQAMFPYRREFLLVLALGSYIFICVQYFSILFVEHVANNWLFLPAIAHTFLVFFALNQTYAVNRKLWLNASLVLNILLMFTFANPTFSNNIIWNLLHYMILGGSIFLIYRTALTYSQGGSNIGQKRLIHSVNITLGFLLLVANGFVLFSFLFFGSFNWLFAINLFLPFILWGFVYAIQIRLATKKSKWMKLSYTLWFYTLLYIVAFVLPLYFPAFLSNDLNNLLTNFLFPF